MSQLDNIQELENNLTSIYTAFRMINRRKTSEKLPDGRTIILDTEKIRILSTILPSLPFTFTPNVILGVSVVHGRGVFTTNNIKSGSLLTLYPADIVCYRPDGNPFSKKSLVKLVSSERLIEKMGVDYCFPEHYHKLKDYGYLINKHYSIMGDPTFDQDPLYLGHFINDRFTCDASQKSKELYLKLSPVRANCTFKVIRENLHVVIIAIKDIKKGEELFMSYGTNYWESQHETKQ
jgi:SET domain-containing protein